MDNPYRFSWSKTFSGFSINFFYQFLSFDPYPLHYLVIFVVRWLQLKIFWMQSFDGKNFLVAHTISRNKSATFLNPKRKYEHDYLKTSIWQNFFWSHLQSISKTNYGVLNSSKKQTKNHYHPEYFLKRSCYG